jgi:hypothetical protein
VAGDAVPIEVRGNHGAKLPGATDPPVPGRRPSARGRRAGPILRLVAWLMSRAYE